MGNSWLGRIIVDRTVDHSGGIHHSGSHRVEAAHGSQITNFRPRRGLPREMGAGRWVGWVVMGWIENPSNQPVLPRLHRRHCNWIINVTECHSIPAMKHLTMMIIFDPVGNSQMFPEEKEASHCPIPNVHFKLIVFRDPDAPWRSPKEKASHGAPNFLDPGRRNTGLTSSTDSAWEKK